MFLQRCIKAVLSVHCTYKYIPLHKCRSFSNLILINPYGFNLFIGFKLVYFSGEGFSASGALPGKWKILEKWEIIWLPIIPLDFEYENGFLLPLNDNKWCCILQSVKVKPLPNLLSN